MTIFTTEDKTEASPDVSMATASGQCPTLSPMSIPELKAELKEMNDFSFVLNSRAELESALKSARKKKISPSEGSSRVVPLEVELQNTSGAMAASKGRVEVTGLTSSSLEKRFVKRTDMIKLTFDKSDGDPNKMFVAEKDSPFFSDPDNCLDFSCNNKLSDHLSQQEWTCLDKEFLSVWNSERASRTPVWKKHCTPWGAIGLWFCIWPCIFAYWLNNTEKKRDLAIARTVAKANKYIFRPRNMFMKLRVEFRKLSIQTDSDYGPTDFVLPEECYYLHCSWI